MRSSLSQRVATVPASGIRKFFDIAATMDDVISLGIGEPDFTTPEPILQAGIRSLQKGETHYTSNAGRPELRNALAEHLKKLHNVNYNPDSEIIFTVGVSEALYLACTAILDPGDEVIIPTPCFVSYQPEVSLACGVPVEVPCRAEDNFDLNPSAVAAAITSRTKAILLGFPNNPTGAVASRQTLLKVSQLAKEHNLIVISDELYDRLVYGVEHVCVAGLPDMRPRTFLLGGFSKNYAMTGWRIGFICAPEEFASGLMRIHQYTIMCASTTAQDAALEALLHGEEFVLKMAAEYDRRRKFIVNGFNQIGLPTCEPHGAFYAFPNISKTGLDDETFSQRLLKEEKVALIPGSYFGAGGSGFVRCSYATAYEKLEVALKRIERFINRI